MSTLLTHPPGPCQRRLPHPQTRAPHLPPLRIVKEVLSPLLLSGILNAKQHVKPGCCPLSQEEKICFVGTLKRLNQ